MAQPPLSSSLAQHSHLLGFKEGHVQLYHVIAGTPKSLSNFHKSYLHVCLAWRGIVQYVFLYLPYTWKSCAARFMYFHSNSFLSIFLFQTHTASWWTSNKYSNNLSQKKKKLKKKSQLQRSLRDNETWSLNSSAHFAQNPVLAVAPRESLGNAARHSWPTHDSFSPKARSSCNQTIHLYKSQWTMIHNFLWYVMNLLPINLGMKDEALWILALVWSSVFPFQKTQFSLPRHSRLFFLKS